MQLQYSGLRQNSTGLVLRNESRANNNKVTDEPD